MSAVTSPPPASQAPPLPVTSRQAARSLIGAGTPAVLRVLLVALIAGSLIWGAVDAWTISQHASAASEVVSTSEPLSITAQRMYQKLSDADITATTSFLAGPLTLSDRQRYESDINDAAADLATLRGDSSASAGSQFARSLAAISAGLPVYTGYVKQAQTYSSLGYQLAGGSFIQVASEEMHLTLLPAARTIYTSESASLSAASAQATGVPWIAISALLAIALAVALFGGQNWLRRRTHRTVNYGLLLASASLAVVTIWMAVAFVTARSDFGKGLGHGSTPAEALAQAGIAAQEARGDQVLNLISRSGSTSFQQDASAAQGKIGPGPGSLLDTAGAAAPAGVSAAGREARAWYSVSREVYTLDSLSNYAREKELVIGTGSGSSDALFKKLEADIRQGIAADQTVFRSNAASGSTDFDGLEAAIVVAVLLMAVGSAWGLSQRLAEYR